ncbi:putative E3 ubiquitin-protein ligase LIN isoform X1 [Tripterygium wilfordii]|uniref:putative E3 ubiquitin-protein ligase LIN isoform X1 n=1 Tax=Tripterygium wilfordii TaxID=458696 RepID=UPI0018F7F4B3|nr:putative E3 ubiquitin-protein ligase LIN isoform X1 [Tripterygium wilfordii]
MSTTTATPSEILRHTTAFLSELLSQPDLRHRLLSTLRNKISHSNRISSKSLNLAAETLENAISTSDPYAQSSSLYLAEKLLLSYPHSSFSSILLSLIYSLCNQPTNASLSLLRIFSLEPLLARSDIAPILFEELFLVHLLPVLQWFNEQKSRIMSSLMTNSGYESDENSIYEVSVVLPSNKLLSHMSGDQAFELKELESSYEEVLDENCRVFANYFKEVLENSDANKSISPPSVILKEVGDGEHSKDEKIKLEELGFKNGRYNPIWTEKERSVELRSTSGSSKFKSPPFYPERISPELLKNQNYRVLKTSPNLYSDSEVGSSLDDNSADYLSMEFEPETQENNRRMTLFQPRQTGIQKLKQLVFEESSFSPGLLMADTDNPPGSGKHTPPKDFVCPITTHLFDDPVTLETGQTYERKAIQEWLDRGNSTCPITRQSLRSIQLPKTNYVLKRLIATWQEQNSDAVSNQFENLRLEPEPAVKSTMPINTSPISVISQAAMEGTLGELRHAITGLCMSEILKESEMAVLRIEQFWRQANMELDIQIMLSKPPVINGFVEILFNSEDPQVLKATTFLLCELGSRDKTVIQTLTRVDSDVECIMALFKKGLWEAVVLIYFLRPSTMSLVEMDLVESLLMVLKKKEEDLVTMCFKPKTASILLLWQILGGSEENTASSIAKSIISTKMVDGIVGRLEAREIEERAAAVGILLKCMMENGKCRNAIADKAELAPVLESFLGATDKERFEIVHFLSELVKLNRRTFNEQILHIIKDEGAFSTMHTLLNYLQIATQDQRPVVAGLLLQLDLLAEPRKMSIYREEAIDTLISCLRNSNFPAAQITAAETIASLQGRFTASGKSLTRATLLKRAGLPKSYRSLMQAEQLSNISGEIEETLEEEKAASDWERRMAFVLASHDFGLLFESLAEGLKSRYAELCSASFISATWLVHMLGVLPDTGIRGAARVCLLKRFVSILKSAKDIEDKALSLLAINSFMNDPDGLRDLTPQMKDIKKVMKEIRKSIPLAVKVLKVLSEGNDSNVDMWNHKELVQVDCSRNGEVLSIVCFGDMIFSGHSDGSIKVWTGRGSILHLTQETREHHKAVTSLVILQERLYSGSLDKTARVWSISSEIIHCVQVHDVKDQVHNLLVANTMSCFIPQGAGVKVHSWNGESKTLNPNKYVKCMALVQGKLYCGCHDSSIQEIDLATGTFSSIQSGSRKLLGKNNPIHSLQVHSGLIYAASSGLDGAAVKIWGASNYGHVGSLSTSMEVREMAISSELIYLGCKNGAVEIWDRLKQTRVETLQNGTNGRILCMALDENEEFLVTGTSDGRILAWGLF